MQQIARFNNFTDACEHFLFTLATDTPLTETQAKLVAYYCQEIFAKVQSRPDGNHTLTNAVPQSHSNASKPAA